MANFIDFAALKEAFDFDDAIEFLRLDLSPEGNALRGKCPACNKGGARTLIVTPGRGFFCHAAKKGGDQIALIAHVKGIGMRDAGELVQEQLDSAASTSRTSHRTSTVPRRERQEPEQEPATSGLTPLDYLDHEHEDVEALGLSADDAARLGAGYASKGVLRGLVAIPLRDENGTLIGYFGAAEGRFGKLNFPNVLPFKKRA